VLVVVAGCGGGAPPAKAPVKGSPATAAAPPPAADVDGAVAYYREVAPALMRGDASVIGGTDFKRLRRGRMYLGNLGYPKALTDELRAAIQKQDDPAVLVAATKVLELDVTDVEAHMLSFVVENRAGHQARSEFHQSVAVALLDSIKNTGNGASAETAWLVFQVREEYQFLRAGGFEVTKQSLGGEGERRFDVLEAKEETSGRTDVFYFDVTELLAEQARLLGAP